MKKYEKPTAELMSYEVADEVATQTSGDFGKEYD